MTSEEIIELYGLKLEWHRTDAAPVVHVFRNKEQIGSAIKGEHLNNWLRTYHEDQFKDSTIPSATQD